MDQILTQRIHAFSLLLELRKSPSPGLQAKLDNSMADCYRRAAICRLPMWGSISSTRPRGRNVVKRVEGNCSCGISQITQWTYRYSENPSNP